MIQLRPAARRDVLKILNYLETESTSPSIRHRFLASFEKSCRSYERWPATAPSVSTRDNRQPPLRRFAVEGFPKYLALYREHADGITILRVVHGARDLPFIWEGEQDA